MIRYTLLNVDFRAPLPFSLLVTGSGQTGAIRSGGLPAHPSGWQEGH